MKYKTIALVTLALLHSLMGPRRAAGAQAPATRPQPAPTSAPAIRATNIGPEELEKLLADKPADLVLLDVRTPEEFKAGHIAGAVNVNAHDADFEQQLSKLDRTKRYVVYCRTGRRSTIACAKLDALQFPAEKQYHLRGGITEWTKEGHDVEK